MSARTFVRILGVAVAMTWALLMTFIDTRYADRAHRKSPGVLGEIPHL
jgi:hypothetical protein